MSEVQECYPDGQPHSWVKVAHAPDYEGMQCFSCPMCNQVIYWSDILDTWVNVTKKKHLKKKVV